MRNFTQPIHIIAIRTELGPIARLAPPISWPAMYEVAAPFSYYSDDENRITVPRGFQFDGASIPLFARIFLPRIHPNYLQAAALHDWLYSTAHKHGRSRKWCDDMFCEAMGALGTPDFWRNLMWAAVRIGGGCGWRKRRKIAQL